jgi:hypothetical protein
MPPGENASNWDDLPVRIAAYCCERRRSGDLDLAGEAVRIGHDECALGTSNLDDSHGDQR